MRQLGRVRSQRLTAAFPDPECPSGRSYGDLAGEDLGGTCVPLAPTGDGTGTSTSLPSTSTSGIGPTSATQGPTSSGGSTVGVTDSVDDTTSTDPTIDPTSTATDPATGSSESTAAPVERVEEGNIILYLFDEAGGDSVTDHGSYLAHDPTDLTFTGDFTWQSDGLEVVDAIGSPTGGSSTKLRTALTDTNELTVEAWVTPTSTTQFGPARIVTYSFDSTERTFTLGHGTGVDPLENEGLAFRLRTSDTTENGLPQLENLDPLPSGALHIVYTRDTFGGEILYLDAEPLVTGVRTGTITVDLMYDFALGNENSLDRPWQGTYHLVAIYSRALSSSEVAQNRDAGF